MKRLNNTAVFMSGMLIGASLIFTGLIATPTVCRKVVLQDLASSAEYNRELVAVLPAESGDFLAALVPKGRK